MQMVYSFARDVVTKYHKLGGFNNRSLLSQDSGGEDYEMEVLEG